MTRLAYIALFLIGLIAIVYALMSAGGGKPSENRLEAYARGEIEKLGWNIRLKRALLSGRRLSRFAGCVHGESCSGEFLGHMVCALRKGNAVARSASDRAGRGPV